MFDVTAYHLSDEELDAIFNEVIAPVLFGDLGDSAPDPILIFIGAQPGAGKSRAGAAARRKSRHQVVEIIGDDLRPFHPRYRELSALHPSAMPDATAQAMGAWVERSIKYAAEHRVSALVEGTFRRPEVPVSTARQFHDNGYKVHVYLLAVAPEVSRLSIADRFVGGIQQQGVGRFTSLEAHDVAFAALGATTEALHSLPASIDRFFVRDRVGILYDSDRNDSGIGPEAAKRALAIARREWDQRMIGIDEFADWQARARRVAEFLTVNYGEDPAVQRLLAQLKLDEEFLDLRVNTTDGEVVRGALLANGEIVRPRVLPLE